MLLHVSLASPSSRRRFARAAGTAVVCWLLSTLVLTILLASYWASQTNYPGHHHKDGTVPHTHSIYAVLGHGLTGAVSSPLARLASQPTGRHVLPDTAPPTTALTTHRSRAPPATHATPL